MKGYDDIGKDKIAWQNYRLFSSLSMFNYFD